MQTLENIQNIIKDNVAVLLYFSSPTCNVCHALKPKLFEAVEESFENMKVVSIDISKNPDIAANFSVFSMPTVLVFLEEKEFLRKSRNMSVAQVVSEIQRPYKILFS